MADPIETLIPPTPGATVTRGMEWAKTGKPEVTPATARARIKASRAKRRKPVPKTSFSVTTATAKCDAIDMMSERFESSRSAIIKRFVDDGILKYGNDAEKQAAGLATAPRVNPFEEVPTVPAGGQYFQLTYPGGMPDAQAITSAPQPAMPDLGDLSPMGGPPLPTDPSVYEDV